MKVKDKIFRKRDYKEGRIVAIIGLDLVKVRYFDREVEIIDVNLIKPMPSQEILNALESIKEKAKPKLKQAKEFLKYYFELDEKEFTVCVNIFVFCAMILAAGLVGCVFGVLFNII